MATTQASHDPALTSQTPAASSAATAAATQAAPSSSTEVPQSLPLGLGQEQVMAILKHLPGVFNRVSLLLPLTDHQLRLLLLLSLS